MPVFTGKKKGDATQSNLRIIIISSSIRKKNILWRIKSSTVVFSDKEPVPDENI